MAKRVEYASQKTKDRFLNYYNKIVEIIMQPEMGVLPGQIAFSLLLSLVPIITLLGYAASFFGINLDSIIKILNNIVPGGASALVPYLTGNNIDIKLTLIFIWMFYLASSGCNSIILISNQIYGINQSNWIKRRIKAIFMTISIIILLLALLLIPIFGNKIIGLFNMESIVDNFRGIYHLIKGPILWILLFVFIRIFYEIAPDRTRKHIHLNTGAIFTTVGWIIVTYIYTFLSGNMTNYNFFYGALSNIAFLMLWLYFMSYIFVIGLTLNYGEEYDKEIMNKTGAVKVIKNR